MSISDQEKILGVIDFETQAVTANATVLSLAITAFKAGDTNTVLELSKKTVYWNFSLEDQVLHRDVDQSTLTWWSQQSEKAQAHHRAGELLPPVEVLKKLIQAVQHLKITYLVGNGIGFDNVLLANLCQQYKVRYPTAYWADLDLRTMRWMANCEVPQFPKELTAHIASHDTIAEAMVFQAYYKDIQGYDLND